MPQLNPNPWLSIMILSWFTFSILIQPKLLTLMPTNQPTNKIMTTTKTPSWTWPWT